jgi:hypothetical protein
MNNEYDIIRVSRVISGTDTTDVYGRGATHNAYAIVKIHYPNGSWEIETAYIDHKCFRDWYPTDFNHDRGLRPLIEKIWPNDNAVARYNDIINEALEAGYTDIFMKKVSELA